MKTKKIFLAILMTVLVASSFAPRAQADPLTVMAIVGVATVLTLSTADIVTSDYDGDKEQRAQVENTDQRPEARVEVAAKASGAGEPAPSATN